MIELLQGLSGYRYAEFYDLVANTVGVTIGCLIAIYLSKQWLTKADSYLSFLRGHDT